IAVRCLAGVVLAVPALMLWRRDRREVWVMAGLLSVLMAGLLTTLSQSSLIALLVGLAVLGALRFGVRAAAAVTGALLVAGLVVVLVAPGVTHVPLRGGTAPTGVAGGR